MKKSTLSIILLSLLFFIAGTSCESSADKEARAAAEKEKLSIEHNLWAANLYHELNVANIDTLLNDDFIGHNEQDAYTWDKESHRKYLGNGRYKEDAVFQQVAEGDWVATRFARTMLYNGDTVYVEAMHFKRFKDGKISEIWEYGDSRQVSQDEE